MHFVLTWLLGSILDGLYIFELCWVGASVNHTDHFSNHSLHALLCWMLIDCYALVHCIIFCCVWLPHTLLITKWPHYYRLSGPSFNRSFNQTIPSSLSATPRRFDAPVWTVYTIYGISCAVYYSTSFSLSLSPQFFHHTLLLSFPSLFHSLFFSLSFILHLVNFHPIPKPNNEITKILGI